MNDQLRAWLITAGAPQWVTDPLGDAGNVVVVPLVLGAVNAGLRAVEPHLPAWAARLLLGSATPPTYPPAG